jgi:hypothetical protein
MASVKAGQTVRSGSARVLSAATEPIVVAIGRLDQGDERAGVNENAAHGTSCEEAR